MEMEFFCPPETSAEWHEFWIKSRYDWWLAQGLSAANLQRRDHDKDELSHYSSATADIEYRYPFTAPDYGELEGVAHRGDFDLTQHQTHSKTKLDYFDQEANRHYLPHVIEPAAGLTRGVLALLCEAYQYDESRASPEWLKLKPSLAPVKLGIFPLVNKEGMPEVAEKLFAELRQKHIAESDVTGYREALRTHGRNRRALLHHGGWRYANRRAGNGARPRYRAAGAGGYDQAWRLFRQKLG